MEFSDIVEGEEGAEIIYILLLQFYHYFRHWQRHGQHEEKNTNQYPVSILPVLKIGFGPHTSNLGTLWSTKISFVLHGPLKFDVL